MELKNHHLKRMSHSLGINLYNAIISDKKKDRTLPNSFYRNFYQKDVDYSLDELVRANLAIKDRSNGLNYYFITEEGKSRFVDEFNRMIKYVPPMNRDKEYVKSKITLYCWYHDYTLSADDILEEYKKYINKLYVSHSVKDVIQTFSKDLKKIRKNEKF